MQTRTLAGYASLDDPPYGECTADMLDTAKRNVERHFGVVGLTEYFAESVVLLGDVYGWPDLAYVPTNVLNSPDPLELAPESLATIRRENTLDLELYEFAQNRFEERLRNCDGSFHLRADALRRISGLAPRTQPDEAEGEILLHVELFRLEHDVSQTADHSATRLRNLDRRLHRLERRARKRKQRKRRTILSP